MTEPLDVDLRVDSEAPGTTYGVDIPQRMGNSGGCPAN